jgi:SAM-dependent methyltransferase
LKRIVIALIKRWGSAAAKKRVWDAEYSSGKWSYNGNASVGEKRDSIYDFLRKYGTDGNILDLGCGNGMTSLEMSNCFLYYLGVDVSAIAIEKARSAVASRQDRADKVFFTVGDIARFTPAKPYSVILFRESIYYIPQGQIKNVIIRYSNALSINGVLIARLCDRVKYKPIIQILTTHLDLVEEYEQPGSLTTIIVCRCRVSP